MQIKAGEENAGVSSGIASRNAAPELGLIPFPSSRRRSDSQQMQPSALEFVSPVTSRSFPCGVVTDLECPRADVEIQMEKFINDVLQRRFILNRIPCSQLSFLSQDYGVVMVSIETRLNPSFNAILVVPVDLQSMP